jgi:hypothetical protein
MTASTGSFSYGHLASRESLWDQIKDLDVIESYVTSNAAKVDVTNKIHAWPQDPITATSSQAGTVELTDTSYVAANPTLLYNTTQIIEKGVRVTATLQNTKMAGFADKFAREQLKKMKEWKNQLEFSAVAGAMTTGTGTAARTMQGIAGFASTLATTQGSSVSLTSDMLNSYLGNAWEAGDNHDTILVGRTLKERISAFTSGNTRNIEAKAAELVGRVDVYDSDHGRVEIVKHRYVNNITGTVTNTLVSYIKDYVQVGFMDEPHFEDRAQTGYFKSGAIVGEATMQVDNELAVQCVKLLS